MKMKDFDTKIFTDAMTSFDRIVVDDGIFRIHGLTAAPIGILMLWKPQLLPGTNEVLALTNQSWAFFILAVALISFCAPGLVRDSKILIARVLFLLCASESVLYASDIVSHFGMYILSPIYLFVSVNSLILFTALAYGYLSSGSTGFFKKVLPAQ